MGNGTVPLAPPRIHPRVMLHAPGPESNRCARMPTAFGLVVLAHCLDYCRIGVKKQCFCEISVSAVTVCYFGYRCAPTGAPLGAIRAANPLRRNPKAINRMPNKIAKPPINQTTASAPTTGCRNISRTPKSIETTPESASSHSCSMCFRRRIAAAIWKTPISTAQDAMNSSSTSAVIPGQRKVTTPAAIPRMPTMTSDAIGLPSSCMVNAAISAITPSAIAYAPHTRTSAANVMPGQMNAKIPNSTAKTPRSTTQCQARAKFPSIDGTAIFSSLAANVYPHRMRRFGAGRARWQLAPRIVTGPSSTLAETNYFILLDTIHRQLAESLQMHKLILIKTYLQK